MDQQPGQTLDGPGSGPGPETRCGFPGCFRPRVQRSGPGAGRPPKYCEDPAHNRGTAKRERERQDRIAAQAVAAAAAQELPTAAAAAAHSESVLGLVDRVGTEVAHLLDQLQRAAARIEELEKENARLTARLDSARAGEQAGEAGK
ncbi:hypothetical protein ACVW0K_007311 [Streptomyces filamentosus]